MHRLLAWAVSNNRVEEIKARVVSRLTQRWMYREGWNEADASEIAGQLFDDQVNVLKAQVPRLNC